MKTVKLLKKVNVVFLGLIILMGLGTLIAGKSGGQSSVSEKVFNETDSADVAQIYGDEPLAEFDLYYDKDSATIGIFADSDLLEIVRYDYTDSTKESVSHFPPAEIGKEMIFRLDGMSVFHLKTKRGVTSIGYIANIFPREGFLMLNGKLHAVFTGSGVADETIFKSEINPDYFKNTMAWSYVKGSTPERELALHPELYPMN